MNSFILAGALTLANPNGHVLPDQDAGRYFIKAVYKQTELDKYVSKLEKQYLKLDRYPEMVYLGIIGRGIAEKKITYTWRF